MLSGMSNRSNPKTCCPRRARWQQGAEFILPMPRTIALWAGCWSAPRIDGLPPYCPAFSPVRRRGPHGLTGGLPVGPEMGFFDWLARLAGEGEMTNDSVETMKAIARRFFEEVWNQGNEEAIDAYLAAETVGNSPSFGTGREAFRDQWRTWRAAFPDIHFAVEDLVGEGDKVVTRWTMTGTHRGAFWGIPATGRRVTVTGMSLDRIADGRIVSGFDAWDELGLRRQLGTLPDEGLSRH